MCVSFFLKKKKKIWIYVVLLLKPFDCFPYSWMYYFSSRIWMFRILIGMLGYGSLLDLCFWRLIDIHNSDIQDASFAVRTDGGYIFPTRSVFEHVFQISIHLMQKHSYENISNASEDFTLSSYILPIQPPDFLSGYRYGGFSDILYVKSVVSFPML